MIIEKKDWNIRRLHSENNIHIQVTICQLRNLFQYILQSKPHKFHLQTNPSFLRKSLKAASFTEPFFMQTHL